ncbi:LysR family transcriptional regulator [Parendozoicomonas sp. Alg238-R29]|uniref:LysR family transcriptional regulator n=1 Tax=Parendozoicomonas sp. Alg238-R29 TaxID=2993446 RepID=UPI00248E0690|nr:LysR family transcriptional regulator [Parendozoicomonas sp. Alg238-R29]
MSAVQLRQNHMAQLSRINLNLLPHLNVLLETVSVSESARVMCVAQSTMSKILAQLRDFFHDPLLVRKGNHSILTDKAQSLKSPIKTLMESMSTLFDNQNEDPSTSTRTFHIALGPQMMDIIMPPLVAELHKKAPGLKLDCRPASSAVQEMLTGGDLCLAICNMEDQMLPGLKFHDFAPASELSLIMDKDHPLAKKHVISKSDMLSYSYVQVRSGFNNRKGIIDYFQKLGLDSEAHYSFPSIKAMLLALENTELLAFFPNNLQLDVTSNNLVMRPIQEPSPNLNFRMAWPEHWQYNRLHRWFRELVSDVTCHSANEYAKASPLPANCGC